MFEKRTLATIWLHEISNEMNAILSVLHLQEWNSLEINNKLIQLAFLTAPFLGGFSAKVCERVKST
jgi:hypothetical protein